MANKTVPIFIKKENRWFPQALRVNDGVNLVLKECTMAGLEHLKAILRVQEGDPIYMMIELDEWKLGPKHASCKYRDEIVGRIAQEFTKFLRSQNEVQRSDLPESGGDEHTVPPSEQAPDIHDS